MFNKRKITAITLAATLALFAAGCKKKAPPAATTAAAGAGAIPTPPPRLPRLRLWSRNSRLSPLPSSADNLPRCVGR
jgi:hypothetical protein